MENQAKLTQRMRELRANRKTTHALRQQLKSKNVFKIQKSWEAASVADMIKDGRIVVADWNRDEVKARAGTARELMVSLLTGADPGKFLAFHDGKHVKKDGSYQVTLKEITKENPLYIYEGGHRSRWLREIFSNEVSYEDMTLDDFKEVSDPTDKDDEYTAITTTRIDFAVAVTDLSDGIVPIQFLKHEFQQTNQNICPLTPGELISVQNDVRSSIGDAVKAILKRNLREKDRDGLLVDLQALVNGLLGRIDLMNKKNNSITEKITITDEQRETAELRIKSFGEIETQLDAWASTKDKKTTKRMKDRQLELSFDGTIAYALTQAETDKDREYVVETVVDFYKKFFEDNKIWEREKKYITKSIATEKARNFTEVRFKRGWSNIKSKVYPPQEKKVEIVDLPTPTSD